MAVVSKGNKILSFILRPKVAIAIAIIQRIIIFFWGLYQDANMEPRFTDIDYFVFTDASRFMASSTTTIVNGAPVTVSGTPYDRETYRYTPILAWLLVPTSTWFFSFGKVLFAVGDIVAGVLILRILIRIQKIQESKAVLYTSAVWLLNPMVSAISTRGSSEGLLGAIVMVFVYAVSARQIALAGLVAGFAVHFKIYPIIYIPTVIWSLASNTPEIKEKEEEKNEIRNKGRDSIFPASVAKKSAVLNFVNRDRVVFGVTSAVTFLLLTLWMYQIYGWPFLQHTYLHHLSRIDHRHNYSPYSTLLYMSSSPPATESYAAAVASGNGFREFAYKVLGQPSAWAFFPQLLLSGILLPLLFAKRDVPKTLFLQTFAFVTFNKVCTAQYFMWYMVLLPFYLPSLINYLTCADDKNKKKGCGVLVGLTMAGLWVGSQVLWVRQAYLVEFLGVSTFYPGLFTATLIFFIVNCLCLGLFIRAM